VTKDVDIDNHNNLFKLKGVWNVIIIMQNLDV
jgi:hypothetical protein